MKTLSLFIFLLAIANLNSIHGNIVNSSTIKSQYDFIVIGIGTSGSVVTRRLYEMGATVLALEGGGNWANRTGLFRTQWGSWNFYADANPNRGGYKEQISVGKTTGGSMKLSNNGWEQGDPTWYDDLSVKVGSSKYKFSVAKCLYDNVIERNYLSNTGKIQIQQSNANTVLANGWKTVGNNLGLQSYNDCRTVGATRGFCFEPSSLKWVATGDTGVNSGSISWQEYAYDMQFVPTVDVAVSSRVTKLLTQIIAGNKVATGVSVVVDGYESKNISARLGVILVAGPLNNPEILMRSGIGDAATLSSLGIPVFQNLPAVGRNLGEPGSLFMLYNVNFTAADIGSPATPNSRPTKPTAFIRTIYAPTFLPDLELIGIAFIAGGTGQMRFIMYDLGRNTTGETYPFSKDGLDLGNVNPRYLATQAEVTRKANFFTVTRQIVAQLAAQLPQFSFVEQAPTAGVVGQVALENLVRQIPENGGLDVAGHWGSSCIMGPYNAVATSVVNPDFQVQGVRNLYIGDTSVFVNEPAAGGIAPGVYVGEMLSQFLSRYYYGYNLRPVYGICLP